MLDGTSEYLDLKKDIENEAILFFPHSPKLFLTYFTKFW
jgi:hypothetical protein